MRPSTIEWDRFVPLQLKPDRTTELAFNLYADDTMRLNQRLYSALHADGFTHIQLYIYPGGELLALYPRRSAESNCRPLRKSDGIRMPGLVEQMKICGKALPAHFVAEYVPEHGCWLCDLAEDHPFPTQKLRDRRVRKPRKNGLEQMLPKEGDRL